MSILVSAVPIKKAPWWFHMAIVGKSAGVGIGVFAGLIKLVPGWGAAAGTVLAVVSTLVTHYAAEGVQQVEGTPPATK